jgi:hypothetical protein
VLSVNLPFQTLPTIIEQNCLNMYLLAAATQTLQARGFGPEIQNPRSIDQIGGG